MTANFSLPWDHLDASDLSREVIAWASRKEESAFARSDLEQYFQTVLPRSVFVKSLNKGAKILDLGAGDGSLSTYKIWPNIARSDLSLYAVSLEVGELFSAYDGYEIGDFEKTKPEFGGSGFDAIVCAHFIEHFDDPASVIKFCAERLKSGGRLYLEWPHPLSLKMPSNKEFLNLPMRPSTTNFFDDYTHKSPWNASIVFDLLDKHDLITETYGRVYLPFVADRLRDLAHITNEVTPITLAIWSRFGWAQYLIATRA